MKMFFKMALSVFFVVGLIGFGYAYDEIDVKDGGQIIGHVKFVGSVPKFAPIKVNKNEDYCGNEKPSEVLTVGKDGGVRFAVGYLENVEKGKAITRNKQTDLDQKKCVFTSVCRSYHHHRSAPLPPYWHYGGWGQNLW